MINRRAFLRTAASAAPLLAAGAATAQPADDYQPVGHLTWDSPGVEYFDYATLDGERIGGVVELNDVEGWLLHEGPIYDDPEGELTPDRSAFRTYYRTGVVRVYWKPASA